MAIRTRLTLGLLIAALMGLVGGCMTTAPTVTLSGPPGPYLIGNSYTLTATGNPGSSTGLWTYSFSVSPACGTLTPVTIGPTDQRTVTTTFSPTVEMPSCTLEVTLTTAAGRTAKASIIRAIQGARIIIIKDAVPDDQQDFSFSTTGGLVPATFTLDDDGDPTLPNTQTYTGLAPGTYSVTEADPSPAFLLTAINCTAGGSGDVPSRTATITVTPGATVTCTFVNEKQLGTIVINKTALGGDATFSYTSSIPGNATFTIATSGGSGSQTFANLNPGSYTVTEQTPPAGWDFTSLACVDPDNGTTTVGPAATIDLDPGETVTCTYTNTRRGTIIINKTAVGGDDTFAFTTSGTGGLPATFQITTTSGTGSQTFSDIVPGSHTVTEDTPPVNWVFTSLACVDPDGGTTTVGPTATIDLDPGETVTCTYTDTYIPPPLPQCPANLIAESEPNDSNATAQALNLEPGQGVAIVSGGITPAGDLDYFQITVTEPSLVFASVRTNIASVSTDSTLFIGVAPVTTGSGCAGTGFIECDDDDGDQAGLSSSIAGRSLSPGTYNILVKQWGRTGTPGTGSAMVPYRLYVAVVPATNVISESEPNDTPSTGYTVMSCPFVVTGVGGGTGGSDYYRFNIVGGNSVLWASALQATGWDSRLELWADIPTPLQIPWVGAAGSPHCNGAGATAPISESCSKHYEYQAADTWPTWPQDYAVNIRPVASPTGTGGTYTMLIVVMTDVGTPLPPPPPAPAMLTACPSSTVSESEPNDSTATATDLDPGLAAGNGTVIVNGGITPAGDLDYYRITLTATSLVFANVRTNLATASTDSTLFIGVNPATTGSSCAGTGFTECDDDDGLQAGLSSTISGLQLDPGTYYILVKQYGRTGTPGSGSTMAPYRLYVAVVPTTAISETEPNDSPAYGNEVTACPALFSGTTATGGSDDFFRFQLPAGNYIAWVSVDEVPIAPPRAVSGWNSQIQFWVSTTYPFFTQRPWVTGTGVSPTTALNCDGGATTNLPPSESCTVDPVYQSADAWPGAGVYSIAVRPSAATTGSYRVLIVVWPAP